MSENGWLAGPDNLAFDDLGRLWIATDMGSLANRLGFADGMYACDVETGAPFLTRHFFRVPIGAEMTGPEFTPDSETLFVAVQHPADRAGSTFENPLTRWPDFEDGVPPRPAVVAITRRKGGRIGT